MRRLTPAILAAGAAIALSWPARGQVPAAATPVFADSFDDGAVADAPGAAAFWTRRGAGTAEEADGKLVLTASGPEYANLHLVGPLRPDLDFLRRPLTFRVDGLELGGDAGVTPEQRSFRFTLAAAAGTEYQTPDALGVDVRGDGVVRLGYKLDTPDKDPAGANLLATQTFAGPVSGFDLTLGPDGYELVVRHADAAGAAATETFAGRYADVGPGLTPAAWGDGGAGASALVLLAQRGPTEDAAAAVTVKIAEVRVTPAAP